MKEIIAIHFEVVIQDTEPLHKSIELPDPKTEKDLMRNYRVAKLLAKGKDIEILIEEKCPYCKERTIKGITLKELKKRFKNANKKS